MKKKIETMIAIAHRCKEAGMVNDQINLYTNQSFSDWLQQASDNDDYGFITEQDADNELIHLQKMLDELSKDF